MMDIPEQDAAGLRKFGLITGAIFAALFGLLFPWLAGRTWQTLPLWPWVVSGVLWVWALALPATLNPVYRGWMRVGNAVGWVNTRILLAIVFYCLVMPMGLVMRMLGKRPLLMRGRGTADSYRSESTVSPREKMERPY
ncbi:MAG: SxtJ family membrane protein [Leptospirillia bacterium]